LALIWFLAGVLTTLVTFLGVLPWLRKRPGFGRLSLIPWQTAAGTGLIVAAALGLHGWLAAPELPRHPDATALSTAVATNAFTDAVRASGDLTSPQPAPNSAAGPMDSAIAALEARLAKGGGSADDWELLAKSYEFLHRPADASKARARQLPHPPPDASDTAAAAPSASVPLLSADSLKLLAAANKARQSQRMNEAAGIYAQLAARGQMTADSWADYADTAATLQHSKLAGDPETFVARALALNPLHPKALWLKASADEEAGRFADAALVWQRLKTVLSANSTDAKIVASNLQQDVKLAGTTASGASVSGEVSLAAALSAKAAAGATLFIVAKSVDSPGPPVAVYRGSVSNWPVKFTLDDSQSMLPGRNLSNAGRVTIEARISPSGRPLPTAGDLQGSTGIINPADRQPLKILIDRVIT
jgi:cytochrome c-type biogenesis protein CcmH/NrfG